MHLVRVATLELIQIDINDLALNTTLYYAADLSFVALDIGLSCALFGILTLLVIVAAIFLIRKGLGHRPVKILIPSTLLLYGSTALYMASLASHVVSVDRLVAQAQAGLFSDTFTTADVDSYKGDVLKQSWMMTIALCINLIMGDSIVWWRVCALWQYRVVYCVGPVLIILVFGFGVKAMSGMHKCIDPCRQPEMLLQDGFFFYACAVLSLVVNMLATALIGYKAWEHRKLLSSNFGHGRQKSRAMRSLALLVESGTIYCLLLIIVVVSQGSSALFAAPDVHQSAFLRAVADYTYACFVPIIAIYPVLIIVIVALNWSAIEHGFSDSDGSRVIDEGLGGPYRGPPMHLGFNRATTSTVAITDSVQMRCMQSDDSEDGAAETKTVTRQGSVVVI